MDSIGTIIANFGRISDVPTDWSANGGAPWLIGTTVFMATVAGVWLIRSAQQARREQLWDLYDDAEDAAAARLALMEEQGFIEIRR
jgi:hypothetical protein